MPELGDEMSDDFRGVLADVIDGPAWAGYGGPGAAVRKRGERRRRRLAAMSVAGVAAVAAIAVAGSGLAAGGSGAVSATGTGAGPAEDGRGRYVDLTHAMLTPSDVGTGLSAQAMTGGGPFHGDSCRTEKLVDTVGSSVSREFDGDDADGVRLLTDEELYQFADADSAKQIFEAARSSARTEGCWAASPQGFQDVSGVGDGMFVTREGVGGPYEAWFAYTLVGGVVVQYRVTAGSDKGLTSVPDAWLTGVMRRAVSRVRNAPRTDDAVTVPEPAPLQSSLPDRPPA